MPAMQPGSILRSAVERVPLVGHEGKSGALLERVRLADGRRLVVKRFEPHTDLLMAMTGDTVGREYLLWSRGVLDRLPEGVSHAVVDGWTDEQGAWLVMRDVGDSVLTWDDRLDASQVRWMIERVTRLHEAFLGDPPEDLARLDSLLGLFAPHRMRPHVSGSNPLPGLALRGWKLFAEAVSPDVAGPVLALLSDTHPLVDALNRRPVTLIHGDLATVNMAFDGDDLVLLDWGMPSAAPGAVDVARFVAGCASVVETSREELLDEYAAAAGPSYDETALRLALLGGLVWLGWNKALDAAEHPDPEIRDRERKDLDWWVRQARRTLSDGLL